MNALRTGLALSLLAVLPHTQAQAQDIAPVKLVASLVGGLSAASGNSADSWQSSYSVGGEVDFTLAPAWQLTGTLAYNEALPKGTTSTEKAIVYELGANFKYILTPGKKTQPYIRFGGGAYNRDIGSDETQTDFGLNGGAGVDFLLPKSPLGFSLIARFHKIFVTSTSTQSGDWEYFNLWGGVRLKLM